MATGGLLNFSDVLTDDDDDLILSDNEDHDIHSSPNRVVKQKQENVDDVWLLRDAGHCSDVTSLDLTA